MLVHVQIDQGERVEGGIQEGYSVASSEWTNQSIKFASQSPVKTGRTEGGGSQHIHIANVLYDTSYSQLRFPVWKLLNHYELRNWALVLLTAVWRASATNKHNLSTNTAGVRLRVLTENGKIQTVLQVTMTDSQLIWAVKRFNVFLEVFWRAPLYCVSFNKNFNRKIQYLTENETGKDK